MIPTFYGRCLMTYNRPEFLRGAGHGFRIRTGARHELNRPPSGRGSTPAGGAGAAASEPWQH